MIERLRRRRPETGFTLIELIVSLTILATITGATTATFLTANNANANVSERLHESNDAQVTSGFWIADAQAAGGVEAALGATDSSLGVFTTGDGGGCNLGGGTLVIGFKWKEWASRNLTTVRDFYTTRVAAYVYRSGTNELERRTCSDTATLGTLDVTGTVSLASRVAAAPITSCNPAGNCQGLPQTVSITVTETNNPSTAPSPYTFTLTAAVRPTGQTAPGAGNAAGSPLLAIGSGVCTGGTATGMSVSGSGTVIVNGQAAINASDVGGCTAMTANGNIQYSADGTSLVAGGTCSGNRCPATTTDATRIGDPFASLAPPSETCTGSGNPALVGGRFQPGVYRSAVTLNGTMDPGTYVFCSTVNWGTVSGTGVFLYFTGSSAISIASQASINLTAQTSGTYAGILMWNATTNAVSITGGGTFANYNGVLYSPNGDVTVAGNSDTYIGMIVAKRIFFSGSHTTDITNGSVTPGAPGLTATSGPALRQVHLSWTAPGYTGAVGFPIIGYEYRVDSGGGYGAWTTVPGGGAATAYDHTCGTSDTSPTTCTYQVRALNGQGAGSASAPAQAPSLVDNTAPVVTVTAPAGNSTIGRRTTFTGTAGNAAGDGTTVVVRVYAGSGCTGAQQGAPLNATRTGTTWSVASASMTDGAKSVCATQTDWAGNTGTSAPVNFTVAPVLGLTLTDANGRLAASDTVIVTFGQATSSGSICTGWNGLTTRTTLTVTVTNNDPTTGNNDSLTVTDSGCAFNFGKINLGSQGWVAVTTNYAGGTSTAVMNAALTTLTIKVGTGAQGPAGVAASTMTYAPSVAMTDALGAAMAGSFGFPGLRF